MPMVLINSSKWHLGIDAQTLMLVHMCERYFLHHYISYNYGVTVTLAHKCNVHYSNSNAPWLLIHIADRYPNSSQTRGRTAGLCGNASAYKRGFAQTQFWASKLTLTVDIVDFDIRMHAQLCAAASLRARALAHQNARLIQVWMRCKHTPMVTAFK